MSFITLIIVISVLVFVHELGHFIVAKLSKVRVDEFSIGFPPRLWSFRRGETLYSLNLILFGGYVKIFGENPDEASISGPDSGRSFINKNRGVQALILIAGVAMNIVFAWILLSGSFMLGVTQAVPDDAAASRVLVAEVIEGSPAEAAGIKKEDIIQSLTDAQGSKFDQVNAGVVGQAIRESGGKPITLTYQRGSDEMSASVVPRDGVVEGKMAIGIAMANVAEVEYSFVRSLWEGTKTTWSLTVGTAVGIVEFFKNLFVFEADLAQVSGPVGIAEYLNQAREFGFSTFLSLVALISINLAVINLVPFPALDGGRLLFVGIESIIRRPLNPKIANTLNIIGFILLLLLMIVITTSDISKLAVSR